MAFIKKKSKWGKKILIVLLSLGLISVALGGYYFASKFINGMSQNYEVQMQKAQRHVYIAKAKIPYGTQLKRELFSDAFITASIEEAYFLGPEDFGRYAKNDIIPEVPVMKYMVNDWKIEDDIREQEFNMFMLQSKLLKNEFVDVRITFPNGEDYIVLSKKKIQDINIAQNTIWLWLDEREILTVSSSLVDAYINKGTKLYVVTYVEPSTQKDAKPNYPASIDIMRLMNSDPNIVNKAKLYLAEQVRLALDMRVKSVTPEAMAKVQAEVSKEMSALTGSIQKELQNGNSSVSKSIGGNPIPVPKITTPSTTQNAPLPIKDVKEPVAPVNNEKKEGAKSGFFN